MLKHKLAMIFLALCVAGGARASSNSGFEDRDFTGYTVGAGSQAGVLNSYISVTDVVVNAVEGRYFAHLNNTGLQSMSAYGGVSGSSLTRHVDLLAGQTYSFKWQFLTTDFAASEQYNDFAYFVGVGQSKLSDIVSVGPLGHSGWQTFSWTQATAFSGNLTWLVANKGDTLSSSHLFIDDLRIGNSSPVPEPATYALLLAGLGLLAGAARRKQDV